MTNMGVKSAAKAAGVRLWELADQLGIADTTLSKKLRYELPAAEQEKMVAAIKQIAATRKE